MSFNDMLKHPSAMLYIFADDAFIAKLDKKTAAIIKAKRANQYQLLAAETGGYSNRASAASQISAAFENMYGITPGRALVKLALGQSVAGKNWAAGVYGVGAVKRNDFAQNSAVTVDKSTGKISVNGTEVTATAIYGGTSGSKIVSYVYRDSDGNTYTSQKIGSKYYAGKLTKSDGTQQNANGDAVTEADTNSIWTECKSLLDTILNWLMQIFGGSSDSDSEVLTSENTIASQTDGFVETSTSTASTPLIVAAALAGGYLLTGGFGKDGKKGKKNKGKKI